VNNNNIAIKAAMHFAQMLIDSNPCRMCGFQLCAFTYIHTCIVCLFRHIHTRMCSLEERVKEEETACCGHRRLQPRQPPRAFLGTCLDLCMRSVVECDTANLAWRVAIAKLALEVKSVHRVVAL